MYSILAKSGQDARTPVTWRRLKNQFQMANCWRGECSQETMDLTERQRKRLVRINKRMEYGKITIGDVL
jgi:hypothetical protein